ncbi:MAG: hypothetical protein JO187_11380 [Acidobacteria bacterium]|nr:hypothetical protein [Acidobacteriota bacterium]
MNCATHPDVPATVYCRTCGKAMCETCRRDVKGVAYCEDCIAARVQGTLPQGVNPAATASGTHVIVTSGPSAGLAGVLAGFFPFGVAPVYMGLYSKGLAHMIIFAALVWAASSVGGGLEPLFGIAIAFFYVYQIIDAVKSAKALQMGAPAPDPFGLGGVFGTSNFGRPVNAPFVGGTETPAGNPGPANPAGTAGPPAAATPTNVPLGAVILIGLGVLFLLHNAGMFHMYWFGHIWPLFLIGLGVWLFLKRSGRV